ncbi:carbohydrate ABC transporter permease [Gracilibacillus alcaliphilus]|uniref:carbohydrate ABC transporter permease n=1 Tax=Gracilibacillus alcaliphilus TaxID=1401441 RepID=UPI001957C406|nr:sugar ABC transporter permease [Gracilibacillus alcaliphilus]MBM7676750.1 ABC-type sugar transport system permease subunit [Gracilibacillus alcaliphilus]
MSKSTSTMGHQTASHSGKWKKHLGAYMFLAPALTLLFTFSFVPILYVIYLSFHRFRLPEDPVFIGFENYIRLFSDSVFWTSIWNTLVYTIGSMFIGLFAALCIAVLLNRSFRGKRFFKVFYFLPTVTSDVISAMIFFWIFDHNLGILNYLLTKAGFSAAPNWLLDPFWAMMILIVVGAWRGASYNIPIFLAGLGSVSKSYYEAAEIDGANGWQKFWKITIPSIMPISVYCMVMSIIGSFQVVAIVDVLTDGGPRNSTLVALKYLWQQSFEFNYVGYGATISLFIFPFLLLLTWLNLKLSNRGG